MPASLQTKAQKQETAESSPRADNAKPGRSFWVRSAVAALALFLLVNILLIARFGDNKPSHDLWNGTGSIEIATKDFQGIHERPHVVLLGSSLMMYPFWAVDEENSPAQTSDIFHHRRSLYMEQLLTQPGKPRPLVYSFAIFGQMVSDAYLYIEQFLKGDRAPDYIVFGIAPRDFHDSDLPAPMATYTFQKIVDMTNFAQYANLYLPSFQDKADFIAGRVCFFYGRRWHFQREVNRAIEKVYKFVGLNAPDTGPKRPTDAAGFMMWGREDVRWNASLHEYMRRYRNIQGKDVELQMNFLKSILDLCAQRHIKVVVVNMPLSDVNRNLMPPGFYDNFRARISAMTNRPDVHFVDLGASSEFVHEDFWDTTHLNQLGGAKLIWHILPYLH